MRVPKEFQAPEAELVVKFSSGGFGDVSGVQKMAELPEHKPSLQSLMQTAFGQERSKDHAGALQVLDAALELYPEDPNLLNNFAWKLVTVEDKTLRDPKRALPLARKAVELTEEREGYILDTLAVALHENGQLKEAAKYAAMAAKLSPEHADVLERAKAYAQELKDKEAK